MPLGPAQIQLLRVRVLIRPGTYPVRTMPKEDVMTWTPPPADLHHPEHGDVTGCDYKDTNLICAADGEDWPCIKVLERRETAKLVDRVSETLKAKIEGDMNRMPEKGMFVCADINQLLQLVRSLS